jgi:hypothetical protein
MGCVHGMCPWDDCTAGQHIQPLVPYEREYKPYSSIFTRARRYLGLDSALSI